MLKANQTFLTLTSNELETAVGGAGGAPLSGDVTQQINTNWGGTQIINQGPKPPTTVLEYWKLHPELRMNTPRPIRPLPTRPLGR